MSTAEERRHYGRVAALCCAICRRLGFEDSPATVHHPRTGVGMGKKSKFTECIPLCPTHHQGSQGVHHLGRKAWERMFGVTEKELTEETKALLGVA